MLAPVILEGNVKHAVGNIWYVGMEITVKSIELAVDNEHTYPLTTQVVETDSKGEFGLALSVPTLGYIKYRIIFDKKTYFDFYVVSDNSGDTITLEGILNGQLNQPPIELTTEQYVNNLISIYFDANSYTQEEIDNALAQKADANHNHTGVYAPATHVHNAYSLVTHNHDARYSLLAHNHDSDYADIAHNHDLQYHQKGGINLNLLSYENLREGGRLDWHIPTNKVVFDAINGAVDERYDVYLMNPDGTNVVPVTVGNPNFPQDVHVGNPVFHPTYPQWVVVQAAREGLTAPEEEYATPGIGIFNDLFAINTNTGDVVQLTDGLTDGLGGIGVLHPQLIDNKILYSRCIYTESGSEIDSWDMVVADIAVTSTTFVMSNPVSYIPSAQGFYEAHQIFSANRIMFSTNAQGTYPRSYNIGTYTISTDEFVNLTPNPAEWIEHAKVNVDGLILYCSSEGIDLLQDGTPRHWKGYLSNVRLDVWVMDTLGRDKKRITFFNDSSHSHSAFNSNNGIVCGDFAFGPKDAQGNIQILMKMQVHYGDGTTERKIAKMVFEEV